MSGLEQGDQCSYQLHFSTYTEGETIEIKASSLLNSKVFIYQGEESLRTGSFSIAIDDEME